MALAVGWRIKRGDGPALNASWVVSRASVVGNIVASVEVTHSIREAGGEQFPTFGLDNRYGFHFLELNRA